MIPIVSGDGGMQTFKSVLLLRRCVFFLIFKFKSKLLFENQEKHTTF